MCSHCRVNSAALLSLCSAVSLVSGCSYQHSLNQRVCGLFDNALGQCRLSLLSLSPSPHQSPHESHSSSFFPHLPSSHNIAFCFMFHPSPLPPLLLPSSSPPLPPLSIPLCYSPSQASSSPLLTFTPIFPSISTLPPVSHDISQTALA